YLPGNRLGRSPSGTTQMPPPDENDRPQWHTSSVPFEVVIIVCLQERPTASPCATRRNSPTSRIPAPPRGLGSLAVFAFVISAAHSPAHAFGCGATVSSGP